MTTHTTVVRDGGRKQLLAGMPVTEHRLELAGVSTAVLDGGAGAPVVLLHGPLGNASHWMRVIPALTSHHRVVVPDLPGHGASIVEGPLTSESVMAWLDALIERTCASPPALVGQALGGAIAARFASAHGERLRSLVLADTLGLAPFQPAREFELALGDFLSRPDSRSYRELWKVCAHDLDGLRQAVGERWSAFESYNIDRAGTPSVMAAVDALMKSFGLPAIPDAVLREIIVPTTFDLGAVRPGDAPGGRRGRERPSRMAAARHRGRQRRPAHGTTGGVRGRARGRARGKPLAVEAGARREGMRWRRSRVLIVGAGVDGAVMRRCAAPGRDGRAHRRGARLRGGRAAWHGHGHPTQRRPRAGKHRRRRGPPHRPRKPPARISPPRHGGPGADRADLTRLWLTPQQPYFAVHRRSIHEALLEALGDQRIEYRSTRSSWARCTERRPAGHSPSWPARAGARRRSISSSAPTASARSCARQCGRPCRRASWVVDLAMRCPARAGRPRGAGDSLRAGRGLPVSPDRRRTGLRLRGLQADRRRTAARGPRPGGRGAIRWVRRAERTPSKRSRRCQTRRSTSVRSRRSRTSC